MRNAVGAASIVFFKPRRTGSKMERWTSSTDGLVEHRSDWNRRARAASFRHASDTRRGVRGQPTMRCSAISPRGQGRGLQQVDALHSRPSALTGAISVVAISSMNRDDG